MVYLLRLSERYQYSKRCENSLAWTYRETEHRDRSRVRCACDTHVLLTPLSPQVRHPNIVTLDDVFVSYSGNLYLVFELLDVDLKNYLDDGHRCGPAFRAPRRMLRSQMHPPISRVSHPPTVSAALGSEASRLSRSSHLCDSSCPGRKRATFIVSCIGERGTDHRREGGWVAA